MKNPVFHPLAIQLIESGEGTRDAWVSLILEKSSEKFDRQVQEVRSAQKKSSEVLLI